MKIQHGTPDLLWQFDYNMITESFEVTHFQKSRVFDGKYATLQASQVGKVFLCREAGDFFQEIF